MRSDLYSLSLSLTTAKLAGSHFMRVFREFAIAPVQPATAARRHLRGGGRGAERSGDALPRQESGRSLCGRGEPGGGTGPVSARERLGTDRRRGMVGQARAGAGLRAARVVR